MFDTIRLAIQRYMHPLAQLSCGDIPSGDIGQVLGHLSDTLDRLIVRAVRLKNDVEDSDISLFGPFIARATIEVAFTAIIARFDPYRVLAIRKSQLLQVYDPQVRNPISFNWTADVRGEEKCKEWDARPGLRDLQRALLCKHFNDLFWEEAFSNLLDQVDFHRGSSWMVNLRKIEPEGFWNSMRSQGDRLYSELSKGIHHEFVIPAAVKFDRITVVDLLNRSWELIAALGVTACYSPAIKPLARETAIDLFEEAQQELNK